ncbi:MAG: sulfate/molybdate ABC transporter ATP-binding protein [Ilumatobacter sp.]
MNSQRRDLDASIRLAFGDLDLDVDLHAASGETIALLGPNGAGKSTTIAALAGTLSDHASGTLSVRIGDRVLDDTERSVHVAAEDRRVGIVFQHHLLFEHLRVLDNVAFGPRSTGMGRRAARALAADWLERLGVSDLTDRRPVELSGGEAQRVAIARTLASQPDLLLLDEPMAALDVSTRSEVRRVLRSHLARFAGPRVLVTHDPSDAFLLADRLIVIERGRVTQCGTPDEIRRAPATQYVAALAGTNLFTGTATQGSVLLDDHPHTFTIADTHLSGPVTVTVHPTAISVHLDRPSGSQRNVWSARVELVEPLGDVVRVMLDRPVPMAIDVTPGAVEALGLTPGEQVWAAVKATEIHASQS